MIFLTKSPFITRKRNFYLLHPLTPTQVVEDQVQIQVKKEKGKKKKKEKERRDKEEEEEESKEYEKAEREKREKVELEKKEKEEEEIILKKGVLLKAPLIPPILIELEILKGVFKAFNSSHFINHSHFLNPIFTVEEVLNPIFISIILNSSQDFETSHFELMFPNRLELTQSKQKQFCEVDIITLQGKTKASTYLYTKGVTYSKSLGRVHKSHNQYILNLKGKDFFEATIKLHLMVAFISFYLVLYHSHKW